MLLAGAGVAVAVGIAADVAAAGVEAAGVVAAVGGGHYKVRLHAARLIFNYCI